MTFQKIASFLCLLIAFTSCKKAENRSCSKGTGEQISKIMLPGDYIAMKLTSSVTTSISALSEGVFWDFVNNELSKDVFGYYGFEEVSNELNMMNADQLRAFTTKNNLNFTPENDKGANTDWQK